MVDSSWGSSRCGGCLTHRPNGHEPLLAGGELHSQFGSIFELVDRTPIEACLAAVCASSQGKLAALGAIRGDPSRQGRSGVPLPL